MSTESADDTLEPEEGGDTAPDGDTTLAALAHASALVASILGPLLILILAEDDDELVEQNAKNSLNFQIVVFIVFLISVPLVFVIIGFFTAAFAALADFVLVIIATLRANEGEVYAYPLTPSLIS